MNSIVSVLFAGAALGSLTVIIRHMRTLPAQVRALAGALADCAETRDVRFTIRTVDVVPLGGNIVRGQFSEARRRPAPQVTLPAAA